MAVNDDMPRVRVQELETFAVVSRERERLQIKRIQKACLGGREGAAGGAGMGHVRMAHAGARKWRVFFFCNKIEKYNTREVVVVVVVHTSHL
jgi:phage-related protein